MSMTQNFEAKLMQCGSDAFVQDLNSLYPGNNSSSWTGIDSNSTKISAIFCNVHLRTLVTACRFLDLSLLRKGGYPHSPIWLKKKERNIKVT